MFSLSLSLSLSYPLVESSVERNVLPPNVAPHGMLGKARGSPSGLPTGKLGNAGISTVVVLLIVSIAMLLLLLGTDVGYTIEEDVMVVMVEGIILFSSLPMTLLPPYNNLDCSAVLGNLGLERSGGTRLFLVMASKDDDDDGTIGAQPPRRLISSSSSET